MKHFLTLMTACFVSLNMQAQQSWNFSDLSESIPYISGDTENWAVDKYKNGTEPVQWHNTFTADDWTALQAKGTDIPATKGLLLNGITKANAVVFSINSSKQNYFKLNSKSLKIKICNLKAGQKVSITGLTGSTTEARGFTAEENLTIESGFETSTSVQTSVAKVTADGDVVIGCTASMNIYSIEVSDEGSTGITQTTLGQKAANPNSYTIGGIMTSKNQKGITISNGKKFIRK